MKPALLLLLLSAPIALSAWADPVPADLSPTLERMAAAVLDGDAEGYLACVDAADPVLHKEQENWAKDLLIHRPAAFAITLDLDRFTLQPDGSVVATVEMTWAMPEARERSVGYSARFVQRDGQWLYAGEQWVRVRAPGVEVLVEPELRTVGLHIAAVLPSVRRRVDDMMGTHVDRVQQVKVYRSMSHLQHSIYLSYTDPLGGWNEPGEAIKLLGSQAQSGRALRSLLAHEYGHCATFDLGPQATSMPWWVLEGVAEHCSAVITGSAGRGARRVDGWARSGDLRSWEQLTDFRGEAMNHQGHVYAQGHAMIAHLDEQFGFDRVVAWLTAMAQGRSLEDATTTAFQSAWTEVDAAWRASLGAGDRPAEPGAASSP